MILKTILPFITMAATTTFGQSLSSGINKENMDLNAKPGTDFYEYAGGGWIKAHPLTPEYSSYAQFNALYENNNKQLRELIEGLAAQPQEQGSLAQKIGGLYRLAMDSTRRNKEGFDPIKPALAKIKAVKNKREYEIVVNRLMASGIGDGMFDTGVEADIRDSKMNLVQIGQGGLSMGECDYYLNDDTATVKIRNAYKDFVRKIFTMTGNDEATAQKKMEHVLRIETRIAKKSYNSTKLRDIEGNYHKMDYAQLLAEFPGINWSDYFFAAGYPTFENVNVGQPEPIHEVEKILEEETLEALKAYTEFKIANDAANSLDDAFRAASWGFYSHVMGGAEEDRPRWKRAVSVVNGIMGMAVGKLYVEKYFPESSKRRMLELVHNLQEALGQRIDNQKWMDEETKKKAREKLAAFYVKIGYPDKWRNYDGLVIDESKSFFDNLCSASRFFSKDAIERKVNKPVDRTEWQMTPQTINAYYDPTTNEICFPAGILQPPFFDLNADDAYNYGAIGVIIGHEMTHGFDDQGAQFDKDGNLSNWWTAKDKKNFESRTKVMEDFFNHIEVLPGMYANGKLTLGENIADHGGLNIAFLALQNAMKKNPLSDKDGYTPEQRFFLSYGLIWAGNIRPEMLRTYNKIDPHSPARLRVNAALPHIDAWYKAFNITKKDPLYLPKEKRADIW